MDQPVRLVRSDRRDSKVRLEVPDQLDRPERRVELEHLAALDSLEPPVLVDRVVSLDRKEPQDLLDRVVPQVRVARLAALAQLALKDPRVRLGHWVHRVIVVKPDRRDSRVQKAELVSKANKDQRVQLEALEQLVQPEVLDHRDH